MKQKIANIYFSDINNKDVNMTLTFKLVHNNIKDNLLDIGEIISEFGRDAKLTSIFFHEDGEIDNENI